MLGERAQIALATLAVALIAAGCSTAPVPDYPSTVWMEMPHWRLAQELRGRELVGFDWIPVGIAHFMLPKFTGSTDRSIALQPGTHRSFDEAKPSQQYAPTGRIVKDGVTIWEEYALASSHCHHCASGDGAAEAVPIHRDR